MLRKRSFIAAICAAMLLAARAPAQAEPFDAKTLERMSTFISNFTEVLMYDLPYAQELTDEQYVRFGVMHEKINNFKRFKQEKDGRASIEASHIANAVERYFGKKFTAHCSVGEDIAYDAKTKRYTITPADGDPMPYARVESAEKLPDGSIRMTGTIDAEVKGEGYIRDWGVYVREGDEGIFRGKFEAVARPHKWNGKDTWALLSLTRLSDVPDPRSDIALDLSAVWSDAGDYLGVIGEDGTRLRIKFGGVKKISDAEYSAEGVLKIHGGDLQKFDCSITIVEAHVFTEEEDDSPEYKHEGVRPGKAAARMTIKFAGGEIKGLMRSTFVRIEDGSVVPDTVFKIADGYDNNMLGGVAKIGGKTLFCGFGLGRVRIPGMPEALWELDQGVGEFIPSEKYHDKGWRSRWDYIHFDNYDALAALGMIEGADPVDRSSVDPAELKRAIDVINEEIYWYSEEAYLK